MNLMAADETVIAWKQQKKAKVLIRRSAFFLIYFHDITSIFIEVLSLKTF